MAQTQLSVRVAPVASEKPRFRAWLLAASVCGVVSDVSTIVVDYCGVLCRPVVSRPRGVGPDVITARAWVRGLLLDATPSATSNGWMERLWSGVAPTVGRVTLCNGYPLRVAACLDFNYSTGEDGPANVFRRMVRLTSFELVAPTGTGTGREAGEPEGQGLAVLCRSGEIIEQPSPPPLLGFRSPDGLLLVSEAPLPVVWDVDRTALAMVIASRPDAVPPLEVECQLTYHVPARAWPQDAEFCLCVMPTTSKASAWALFGTDRPRGFARQGLWSVEPAPLQPAEPATTPRPRNRRCLCFF